MYKKISNVIIGIIKWLFFGSIVYLLVLSVLYTATIPGSPETTYHIKDFWWKHLVVCCIFLCVLVLRKKSHLQSQIKEYLLYGIYGAVLLVFVFSTALEPTADQLYILRIAKEIYLYGDFSELIKGGYLAKCPHQIGIVLYAFMVTNLFGAYNYMAVQVLNVVHVLGLIWLIERISKKMFPEYNGDLKVSISLMLFLPLGFYVTFVYGNIPGMFWAVLAIYWQIKNCEEKKVRFLIGSIIAITIAILLKNNNLIVLIAMCVIYVLRAIQNKSKRDLINMVLTVATYVVISGVVTNSVYTYAGVEKNKGIPMIAYVTMGMQEGPLAEGWWNNYNSEIYYKNHCDYDEVNRNASDDLKERLTFFYYNPGYFIQFINNKNASQWNNPTFQSMWILKNRDSDLIHPWWVDDFLEGGKFSVFVEGYMNVYQTLILVGVVSYCILAARRRGWNYVFMLIFIGGFTFHTIWEAKGQYTFSYFLLIVPYAVSGWREITQFVEKKIVNKEIKLDSTFWGRAKKVGAICVAIGLIALFLPHGKADKQLCKSGNYAIESGYAEGQYLSAIYSSEEDRYIPKLETQEFSMYIRYDGANWNILFPNWGECLDVDGGIAYDGAEPHLWQKNYSFTQKWKIIAADSDMYYIVYEDLDGCQWALTTNGVGLFLQNFDSSDTQKWIMKKM